MLSFDRYDMFYNNTSNNIIPGNITTSISEHLTQFLLVPSQPKDTQLHELKELRSFHNFDPKEFEKDLPCKKLSEITFLNFPLKTQTYLPPFA